MAGASRVRVRPHRDEIDPLACSDSTTRKVTRSLGGERQRRSEEPQSSPVVTLSRGWDRATGRPIPGHLTRYGPR